MHICIVKKPGTIHHKSKYSKSHDNELRHINQYMMSTKIFALMSWIDEEANFFIWRHSNLFFALFELTLTFYCWYSWSSRLFNSFWVQRLKIFVIFFNKRTSMTFNTTFFSHNKYKHRLACLPLSYFIKKKKEYVNYRLPLWLSNCCQN